jgi:hypothetical protein
VRIKEELGGLLGNEAGDNLPELKAAVTAVPDARNNERLVVSHTKFDRSPEELCQQLQESGLRPLWILSPDSFCQVDRLPILGSGKLDLKAIGQLALEEFGKIAKNPHFWASAAARKFFLLFSQKMLATARIPVIFRHVHIHIRSLVDQLNSLRKLAKVPQKQVRDPVSNKKKLSKSLARSVPGERQGI